MSPNKQPPAKQGGKTTIDQENHDQNAGQRQQKSRDTKIEKPTVGPETHGNAGERGANVITNDGEVE